MWYPASPTVVRGVGTHAARGQTFPAQPICDGHRLRCTIVTTVTAERIDLPGGSLEEKSEQGGEGFRSGGGGGGRREGGALFPREISAWQLQWRLQRKVLRLENGLSSQVPFEEIESEVQVSLKSKQASNSFPQAGAPNYSLFPP